MVKNLSIIVLFVFSCPLMSKEELVIIQAVSEDKKTFIVKKGAVDGVIKEMRSLFSNDKFALVARPIETIRDQSVWMALDQGATIPFRKGDVVSYTNSVDSLILEIPILRYDQKVQEEKEKDRITVQSFAGKFIFRMATSFAISEIISHVNPLQKIQRSGIHSTGLYVLDVHDAVNFAFGLRYDREISTHNAPSFQAKEERFFFFS